MVKPLKTKKKGKGAPKHLAPHRASKETQEQKTRVKRVPPKRG